MSSHLYRIGGFAVRHAKLVILLWVVTIITLGSVSLVRGGFSSLNNDFHIPGTEAQEGIDILHNQFPEFAGTSSQIVIHKKEGFSGADDPDLKRLKTAAEQIPDVLAVGDAGISKDGKWALLQSQYDFSISAVNAETITALEKLAADNSGNSITVYAGGDVMTSTEIPLSATEAVGLVLALAVLAITFFSLLAAAIPIITAGVGMLVATAIIFIIASLTPVSTTTPTLSIMLGLAVGIDYALLIVSRHRDQLREGMEVHESIACSVATAGSAVIFAGTTVVIALCALAVVKIPFLTVLGLCGALGVALAVLVAITMIPALLSIFGNRLIPRARRDTEAPNQGSNKARKGLREIWVNAVTKHPLPAMITVVLLAAAMAVPSKYLVLALPGNDTAPEGSPARVTYDLVTDHFGAGANATLMLTADILKSTDPLGKVEELKNEVGRIVGADNIALATPNRSATIAVIAITPPGGKDSPETKQMVFDLRDAAPKIERDLDVSHVIITGFTAVAIDISTELTQALLPFGLIVVGLSLAVLMMVFRSIWVPITATVGYVFSLLAAFGMTGLVFGRGFAAELLNVVSVGPVLSFMPIIVMGVLFGLSMDYEVFLVYRMREDFTHSGDARAAVRSGFIGSARVVTAAAIIMASVFSGFIPSGSYYVQPIAFGLAVGVVFDAFLVRMTFIPAIMTLLGAKAWWIPKRLDRVLPLLDIEGEGLARHLEYDAWEETHGRAVVRVRDLRVSPHSDRVSFTIRPGETYSLTGTESVRRAIGLAVAGRLTGYEGDVFTDGCALPAEDDAVISRVELVTEASQLDEALRRITSQRAHRHSRDRLLVVAAPDSEAIKFVKPTADLTVLLASGVTGDGRDA